MDTLKNIASSYVQRRFAGRHLQRLDGLRLDEALGRKIGAYYDRARHDPGDAALQRMYRGLKEETRLQFDALREAGVVIRPWRAPGQPYRNMRAVVEGFASSGELFVYLTESGHGASVVDDHPMRERSGVIIDGVDFMYNDLLRAVHDLFGHTMNRHSFQPKGEFYALCEHLQMYSPEAHGILFSEMIGQLCYFFFGPHAQHHLPPSERSYPDQKVFLFPDEMLEEFKACFEPMLVANA